MAVYLQYSFHNTAVRQREGGQYPRHTAFIGQLGEEGGEVSPLKRFHNTVVGGGGGEAECPLPIIQLSKYGCGSDGGSMQYPHYTAFIIRVLKIKIKNI